MRAALNNTHDFINFSLLLREIYAFLKASLIQPFQHILVVESSIKFIHLPSYSKAHTAEHSKTDDDEKRWIDTRLKMMMILLYDQQPTNNVVEMRWEKRRFFFVFWIGFNRSDRRKLTLSAITQMNHT